MLLPKLHLNRHLETHAQIVLVPIAADHASSQVDTGDVLVERASQPLDTTDVLMNTQPTQEEPLPTLRHERRRFEFQCASTARQRIHETMTEPVTELFEQIDNA